MTSTYDLLGRKLTEQGLWSDGTAALSHVGYAMRDGSYTYDLAGRMLTAVTDQQTRTYTYDYTNGGRVSSHAFSSGGTFSFGYDYASNLTDLVSPSSRATSYEYDGLNRTTAAKLWSSSAKTTQLGSATLAYDTLGRRTGVTFGDTSSQAYTWEADDDLASIAHVFPGGTSGNVTYTYGYDQAGRETSETISNSAYQYDPPVTTSTYGAASGVNAYPTYKPTTSGSTATVTWYDPRVEPEGRLGAEERRHLQLLLRREEEPHARRGGGQRQQQRRAQERRAGRTLVGRAEHEFEFRLSRADA